MTNDTTVRLSIRYILLALYIVTGTLSNFGAIDILAPQWIYLGLINLISCFFFIFNPSYLSDSYKKIFTSVYIYVYIFYIIWNALSYFYAINPTETLINLPRLTNTFFAIFFCFLLINSLPNKFYYISRLFLAFLVLELFAYYNHFFEVLELSDFKIQRVKGFAGNKNITAASIAFKVPFLLYLLNTSKKRYFTGLVFFVLSISILSISLIEARSAILSSILVIITFIVFLALKIALKIISLKTGLRQIGITLLPYFFALFANYIVTVKTNRNSLNDTVGQIQFTEQSSNGRFLYWSDAYDYFLKNPILASGLGNWKIASIAEGKEHINGYTVPYHAHNDFIHVFTETGILGGLAYLSLFLILSIYLVKMLYYKYKEKGELELQYFFLLLPFIVYGIDANLNFPVARPLMQSSFAIFSGLILTLYLDQKQNLSSKIDTSIKINRLSQILIAVILLPAFYIHVLSYNSLTKQGTLLYEFNNASFKMTRAELDEISHDFPNLTETAMPIKAMKARYYYLQGNKEEAFQMIDAGIKDNPEIFFGENLKAQYFLSEKQIDSAYIYAKKAFEGLPNNMPHYDTYMRTLVLKKRYNDIDKTFNQVHEIAGDTKTIWLVYVRSLAQTRSLGDPFAMDIAAKAYRLYPDDEIIFLLYRILTYGQQRTAAAESKSKEANKMYNQKDYVSSARFFAEAHDLDPLNHVYSLNAGLSYYELNEYSKAINYFDLAMTSKRLDTGERAMRYKGLSLIQIGELSQACDVFLKLRNTYPKRMYQQEFQKYCSR